MRLEERIVLDGAAAVAVENTVAAMTDTTPIAEHDTFVDPPLPESAPAEIKAPAEESGAGENTSSVAQPAETQSQQQTTVLVTSDGIPDANTLTDAAQDDVITVSYSEQDTLNDILSQIEAGLDGKKADTIGFATHSLEAGTLHIADQLDVDVDSLLADSEMRTFWQNVGALVETDGRIDLMGCDLAAGEKGQEFVAELEDISGRDVAASDDTTGNPDDGDWSLEEGDIDLTDDYFDAEKVKEFSGVLAGGSITLNGKTLYDNDSDNSYEIDSAEKLIALSQDSDGWDKSYELTADITFNPDEAQVDWDGDGTVGDSDDAEGFSPIGDDTTSYSGNFQGNEYVISNLYINTSDQNNVGLFGTAFNTTLTGIGLENVDITGVYMVGGLIGGAYAYANADDATFTMSNCYVTGTVDGKYYTGGLVGDANAFVYDADGATFTISNCYATCTVDGGFWYTGGLIGYATAQTYAEGDGTFTINNCYATGAVDGGDRSAGGLIGYVRVSAIPYYGDGGNATFTINNCYATGAVDSGGDTGGLIGYTYSMGSGSGDKTFTINNCYTTGTPHIGDTNTPHIGDTNEIISQTYASSKGEVIDTWDDTIWDTTKTPIDPLLKEVTVVPVSNHAPTLDVTSKSLDILVNEPGVTVASLLTEFGAEDQDPSGVYGIGVNMVIKNKSEGWQYKQEGDDDWQNIVFSSGEMLLLESSTKIRFNTSLNSYSGILSFRVWDGSDKRSAGTTVSVSSDEYGDDGAFSERSAQARVKQTAENHAPTLDATSLDLSEILRKSSSDISGGVSGVSVADILTKFNTADVDNDTADLLLKVLVQTDGDGTWMYRESGQDWQELSAGTKLASTTQLLFLADNQSAVAQLKFQVTDGSLFSKTVAQINVPQKVDSSDSDSTAGTGSTAGDSTNDSSNADNTSDNTGSVDEYPENNPSTENAETGNTSLTSVFSGNSVMPVVNGGSIIIFPANSGSGMTSFMEQLREKEEKQRELEQEESNKQLQATLDALAAVDVMTLKSKKIIQEQDEVSSSISAMENTNDKLHFTDSEIEDAYNNLPDDITNSDDASSFISAMENTNNIVDLVALVLAAAEKQSKYITYMGKKLNVALIATYLATGRWTDAAEVTGSIAITKLAPKLSSVLLIPEIGIWLGTAYGNHVINTLDSSQYEMLVEIFAAYANQNLKEGAIQPDIENIYEGITTGVVDVNGKTVNLGKHLSAMRASAVMSHVIDMVDSGQLSEDNGCYSLTLGGALVAAVKTKESKFIFWDGYNQDVVSNLESIMKFNEELKK